MARINRLILLTAIALLAIASAASATAYRFTTIDVSGADHTIAYGINNAGQIVGFYEDATGGGHGFLKDGNNISTLNYPGPYWTFACKINNLGQIVGTYYDQTGVHGFLKDGNYYPIAYPGMITHPFGINDQTQIVGSIGNVDIDIPEHGFLKVGDVYTTIDFPDYPGTNALDINNLGQIVGRYNVTIGSNTYNHGFLKSNYTYTEIFFPGADETEAQGINNLGQIVGIYYTQTIGHGFIKDGPRYATIDFPGAKVTWALGINDKGQIVGAYWDSGSIEHGFLAEPIRNPAAIYLLLD